MQVPATDSTAAAAMVRGADGRALTVCGWLCVVALLVVTAAAYNVDVSVPVVKLGPRSTSYFGFSVAQHSVWQRHSNRSVPV